MSCRAGRLHAGRVALVLASMILLGSDCDDNLGDNDTRPVSFRVSVGPNGLVADGRSFYAGISGDGRYVVFESEADNLAFPASAVNDILLKDRTTEEVVNITRMGSPFFTTPEACQRPSISADGRWVVYHTTHALNSGLVSTGTANVFRHDLQTGAVKGVSLAVWPDQDLVEAKISADGRYVSFNSRASNLGVVNGGRSMVYVADMNPAIPTLTLVSHAAGAASNGHSQLARLSADGQFVAFISGSTDLGPAVTPARTHMYAWSRASNGIDLVSQSTGGDEGDGDSIVTPGVSADGRFVAFASTSTNLAAGAPAQGVYLRDRTGGTTTLVGDGVFDIAGAFDQVGVSDDGGVVVWVDELEQVRAWVGGVVRTVSLGLTGEAQNNSSPYYFPVLSSDGRWVVWNTRADNLVPGDVNLAVDVYGHGPLR